ncbi:MAG: hypothetical protein HFH14_03895 [Lachnospiraceae bacterium]|nr:hypothetical protein [Lachnospiraceae bacterium]
MEHQNDEIEIDLMEILYVIRSKIVMIILTAMIFGITSGLVTHYMVTPKYSSTSSIYVLANSDVSSISITDLQIGKSLTSDYVQMIQSRTVLENVISNLNMGDELTYQGLLGCISISNPSDTRILNLTVTYDDPRIAKELVDELAEESIERISDIMVTKAHIYEKGYIKSRPVSPNVRKNIIIAFIIGFIFAVGIVIVINLMDDTIHSPEDVEKYLNLNTLAAIPVSEDSEVQIRKDDRKRRGRGSRKQFKKNKKRS